VKNGGLLGAQMEKRIQVRLQLMEWVSSMHLSSLWPHFCLGNSATLTTLQSPGFLSPFHFIGINKNIALANKSIWKEKALFPSTVFQESSPERFKNQEFEEPIICTYISMTTLSPVRRLQYYCLHIKCLHFASTS
jgi:hypothetical protein